MRTEGKNSQATQRFQIEVLRETVGKDAVILCVFSESETSINVK